MLDNLSVIRLRVDEVAAILSVGPSTVWRWTKERPNFPQPRRDGRRCTFWLRDEVERYARTGNTEEVA